MKRISSKLLISIGIATILFWLFLSYQTYSLVSVRVKEVVEQEASMALKFDVAIRNYIAQHVRPAMYKMVGKDDFIPETMSTSFVARTIFEDVRKEFPNYLIKFSSDNPRNLVNQAGAEELKIIDYFNNNPQSQKWEGEISINNKPYFAKFRANRMEKACLRCHGDPKDAPASLVKRYGSTAGFHRPLGKVIGMDTIAIPIAKIHEKLWPKLGQTLFLIALCLLLFFLSIVCLTRFIVTKRLSFITEHFLAVTRQSDYQEITPIEIRGNDEIRDLAVSFNSLSDRLKVFYSSLETLVKDRTQELSDKNEQMKREIKEHKQVEEALRKSKQIITGIIKAIPVRVFWKDRNLVYLGCNDLFAHDAGFADPKDIIGKDDFQMGWRDQAKLYRGDDRQVIESGDDKLFIEEPQTTPEGDAITLLTSKIPLRSPTGEIVGVLGTYMDITERKRNEEEREKLIHELQNALAEVKTLSGLLPICAHCKNVRDDKGYWNKIETYIHQHSEAQFSHGICPECTKKYFPDFDIYDDSE